MEGETQMEEETPPHVESTLLAPAVLRAAKRLEATLRLLSIYAHS